MSNTEPIFEYDSSGKLIYVKNSNGFEYWYEYDTNGNEIHYKNSDGYESWREFDTNGNLMYYKNNDGVESWYDSDGKRIDKPTEKKDNTTMKEYYIKVYAESIESIDNAIGDQVGKNGIDEYYVLTENSFSCAIHHTESHMFIERNEANDLSEYLLNKNCKGLIEPRIGDRFFDEDE